jgi:hypothetical protein
MNMNELMDAINEIKDGMEKAKQKHPYVVPPTFKGREDDRDWEQFLKEYCRAGDALAWEEDTLAKSLPCYLKGEAIAIFDLLTDQEKADWDSIKKAMGDKLSKDHLGHNVARTQLTRREQKPGESVAEFAAAIESLVKKAFPKEKAYTDDQRKDQILDAFFRGIKFNLRKVLIRQARPATLAEAIDMGQKEELNQRMLAEGSGKEKQEALEREQYRMSKEIEKLKALLKEKEKEKVNVVNTAPNAPDRVRRRRITIKILSH